MWASQATAEPIKHIEGTSMNSVWGLFNIWLAQNVSWEHMTDLNNEYRSSDGECHKCWDPLKPPCHVICAQNGMWLTKTWSHLFLLPTMFQAVITWHCARKPQIPQVDSRKHQVLPIFLCGRWTFTGTSHELSLGPSTWTIRTMHSVQLVTPNTQSLSHYRNHGTLLCLTWSPGLLTEQASTQGHWEDTNMSGINQIAGVQKH